MKKALITGITGQDGAYLAEFLLAKGYQVHGIKRRTSLFNTARIDHLYQDPHVEHQNLMLHYGDLTDSSSLIHIVQQVQPDEIYNLAAQSHVKVSFEEPEYTANSDAHRARCGCWRRSACWAWKRRRGSTRRRHRRCTGWCRRRRSGRRRRFIRGRRMRWPSCTRTGSR